MAVKDAPDYTLWTVPTILVGSDAVPETPDTETPIVETEGKVTDSSQNYQTLATWTVSAGKAGILRTMELASDNYPKALFQLTIGGVQKFTDLELPSAWTGFMAESRLAAGTVVLLEGKSSDGTSVDLWGMIEGKEVG